MSKKTQNPQYKEAMRLAVDGRSVFPVGRDKKPLINSWKQYQTTAATPEQIMEWWETFPEANVGIVTGKVSGITVIDVDTHAGADPTPFPETRTIKTGNGGLQLYYKYSEGLSVSANAYPQFPRVDIRNDGGYVVAPPSIIDAKKGGEGHYTIEKKMGLKKFPAELSPQRRKARKWTTY